METLFADLRQAVRVLRKQPGITVIALAALALGIGANTAIFSVVNAVLLRPLPYPQPDRLVRVARGYKSGEIGSAVSIPKFTFWRDHNEVFDAITAYDFAGPGLNLTGSDVPEQVKGIHVSCEYFQVFRTQPVLGHAFSASEDTPGGPRVAILSYGLWQRRFGGDPATVGKTISLSGEAYLVTGVMPAGFVFDPPAEVWMPLQPDPNSANFGHYLTVTARLKPAVSLETAQAQMKLVGEGFRRKYSERWMGNDETIAVESLQQALVGDVRPVLLILTGAVCFVLLIACANVANLLLSRAASRQKEIAIRSAIGATRRRVIRQLLTESVLLAAIGGAAGLLLGSWGIRGLLAMSPGDIPRLGGVDPSMSVFALLDGRVMLFTLGVSVLTGIVFGMIPAVQLARTDLNSTLKDASGRSGTGLHRNRTFGALVVSEVALALVLLVSSALLVRTFIELRNVNPGFNTHNILTARVSMVGQKYTRAAAVESLDRQAEERIEAIPGVVAATPAVSLPLESSVDLPFRIEGKTPTDGSQYHGDEYWRYIGPHYFTVFQIPLLRGRTFNAHDTGTSTPVLIISEEMAKKYWPNEDPIGQRVTIGKGLGPEFADPTRQIVGVVGSVHEGGLARPVRSVMYVPVAQVPDGLTKFGNQLIPATWAVRTSGNPTALTAALQQTFVSLDRLPIANVRTMEKVVAESTARQNFNMLLLTIFGAIALLLAAIGIYGVMSYSVQQRTQELGIRMALGAGKREVLGLVIGNGVRLALIGIVLGLAGAFAMTRLLAKMLFGVKATDPLSFAVIALTLLTVAFVATYLPARRAARIDPIVALRYE